MIDVKKYYDSVERFNDIAGNLSNVTVEKMEAQMKVVVEEIKELQDALDNKDAVGMLDGVCDGFVTLAGLMQQMQRAGFNVDKALERVCENNLTKFIKTVSIPAAADYFEKGYSVEYNKAHDCYVLKDQNGKVRKPHQYESVDIMDYLPDDFFKVAA